MSNSSDHVLFITGEYPPMTGGVGAYTQQLALALIDLGMKTSVLTASQLEPEIVDSRIDVYPAVTRWDWRIWTHVPKLAQQINAAWVHVQYQTAAYGMNPAINLSVNRWRRNALKVAWTYHDLLVPYIFPKIGTRIRTQITMLPAKQADLTIVTNEGDRSQTARIARKLAKIPIGSNIQPVAITEPVRVALRKRLGYCDNDLVIAYFGFLNRSKGGITLIDTLHLLRQQYPDTKLLMIGERVGASDPTNYAYLQEVEQHIDKLNLTSAVQWTGLLDDVQVGRTLSAIDILLMPYEDGASLRRGTLMAGLAQGCAIVTTRPQSPMPELVDGRDLLFIPPGNAQAAVHAIKRLLEDPQLMQTIRSGAKRSNEQFSWQEIARQHVCLYHAI